MREEYCLIGNATGSGPDVSLMPRKSHQFGGIVTGMHGCFATALTIVVMSE